MEVLTGLWKGGCSEELHTEPGMGGQHCGIRVISPYHPGKNIAPSHSKDSEDEKR